MMTTQTATTQSTTTHSTTGSSLWAAAILSITLGAGILFLAGHVQADTLHNAAHDVRHANGFPCH